MKVLVNKDICFEYLKPPPLNHKLLILTKGGVLIIGAWKGLPPGENREYIGYAALPDRDKELERQLGYL